MGHLHRRQLYCTSHPQLFPFFQRIRTCKGADFKKVSCENFDEVTQPRAVTTVTDALLLWKIPHEFFSSSLYSADLVRPRTILPISSLGFEKVYRYCILLSSTFARCCSGLGLLLCVLYRSWYFPRASHRFQIRSPSR